MLSPPLGSKRPGKNPLPKSHHILLRLPLIIAFIYLLVGGIFLLNRADAQARDTIRKHHLQDIEDAIYFARGIHGTYPPYDQPSWCGRLDDQSSETVRQQIEDVLRKQNDLYANPNKPFAVDPDPLQIANGQGYFYWKRSPASFELFSQMEAGPQQIRDMSNCPNPAPDTYNYSLTSVWREL